MIFLTMCVYSVKQRKAGRREVERCMLPHSRRQSQGEGCLEINTHDNRACVGDSAEAATEQSHGERESTSPPSQNQPAVKAITVRAEFALVSQSEHLLPISGRSDVAIPCRSPPEGEPQDSEIAVPGGSRPTCGGGTAERLPSWVQSALVQGRPLTAVMTVDPSNSPYRKTEVPARSKSIPWYVGKRVEQPIRMSGLPLDSGTVESSHFDLRPLVYPGVPQGHTEPTPGDWPSTGLDKVQSSK
ncbi:uncharacterized protein [Hemitrygon akajei]|uniref:uncharacterized protein n=1 Tax=Hemitrygon akajei TaxID=2704970 RepID=UPI003BFA33FC